MNGKVGCIKAGMKELWLPLFSRSTQTHVTDILRKEKKKTHVSITNRKTMLTFKLEWLALFIHNN